MKNDSSKAVKANAETADDVVDAKAGAVVPAQETAVSTDVTVSGARLDFPFVKLAQGMSQWKSDGQKPVPGAFYIGHGKDDRVLLAGGGRANGVNCIVLQRVEGFKEDRKYDPMNKTAPKRWIIAGAKEDGTPVTERDCLEAAAKDGFSLVPKKVGVWGDSGNPIMRANLSRFCYLCMLVQLPDDFASDEYMLYPIGGKMYTTARYEFDKQYYRKLDLILTNMANRARVAHEAKCGKDDGWKWDICGFAGHLFSTEMTSSSGIEYLAPSFERALRDGKPLEYTDAEKADLTKFLMATRDAVASVTDADTADGEF